MTIPDYQTLMRPVLATLADGKERPIAALRSVVANQFSLTEADLRERVPSGQKPLFNDRLSWAVSYLTQAEALTRVRRGVYRINDRGRKLLEQNPDRVDVTILDQFPEFQAFRARSAPSTSRKSKEAGSSDDDSTPEESLESAFQRLRGTIEAELLQQVKIASPEFFEQLVVQLLVAMGYGGTLKDAGQAIGRSGDGGIDGIIKEDRLGLEVIHVQAKRWDNKTVVD